LLIKWFIIHLLLSIPFLFESETGAGLGLRNGAVLPVELGQLQVSNQPWNVRDERLVAAGFQNENVPAGHFGQPVGHDGAGRSGADHHKVVLGVDSLQIGREPTVTIIEGNNGETFRVCVCVLLRYAMDSSKAKPDR